MRGTYQGHRSHGRNENFKDTHPFHISTTGRPKAVQLLARGIIRLTVAPRYVTLSFREWVAAISNPSFDASLFEIWRAILSGGTSVKQTTIDPLALRDTLHQLRITTLFGA
ncbi:hypothetical protein BKA57DRAFT_532790 [Linnemannia elongata]|nr:hypothetical protein BKA57DRAFT_532790 [Linnemannia elongata]